jgi:bifunctional DNase/RNase
MPAGLNPMVVESVRVHMLSSQHVVILKEVEQDRYLPIWIGSNEAEAIARRLQGVTPERPMTHDLFATALAELGVALKQVIVSGLAEATFMARLVVEADGRTLELDARPSDAIALALRADAPIFATDGVLDEAGVRASDAEDPEPDDARLSVFRDFINSLEAPDEGGEAGGAGGAGGRGGPELP